MQYKLILALFAATTTIAGYIPSPPYSGGSGVSTSTAYGAGSVSSGGNGGNGGNGGSVGAGGSSVSSGSSSWGSSGGGYSGGSPPPTPSGGSTTDSWTASSAPPGGSTTISEAQGQCGSEDTLSCCNQASTSGSTSPLGLLSSIFGGNNNGNAGSSLLSGCSTINIGDGMSCTLSYIAPATSPLEGP